VTFAPEALDFLGRLEQNNEREWFHAHRDEYDRLLLEPARDFVEAFGALSERLGEGVDADPRVGRSIMRINRDTRFSRDKRPYKTHLDLWFPQGAGPSRERPGFWFRLTPERLILGAGMHNFERPALERFREEVADPRRGGKLVRAVEDVRAGGGEVGGQTYKRVPAGYDVDEPRGELLRHSGLYAWVEYAPPPAETHTPDFPAFCVDEYRRLLPVQRWLLALLAAAALWMTGAATAAPSASSITFRLVGRGKPLPAQIGSGPCPQGRTVITIASKSGARIGTAHVCVLTIEKTDDAHGLRRIVQTVLERDVLPAGTIVSRQRQTFVFARDQRHSTAILRGRVVRGTRRYAGSTGTVSGGGPAVDGFADWRIMIRLR
jgi:uncharacterized protein (TIGR02453 family)